MPATQPTNHLDAESVAWLEDFLREFGGTVVAITHDRCGTNTQRMKRPVMRPYRTPFLIHNPITRNRYFLDNVAGWILELDRGEGIPFEGNYSGWLERKAQRIQQEGESVGGHNRVVILLLRP